MALQKISKADCYEEMVLFPKDKRCDLENLSFWNWSPFWLFEVQVVYMKYPAFSCTPLAHNACTSKTRFMPIKGTYDSQEQHILHTDCVLVSWILVESLVKLPDLLLVDSSLIFFVLFCGLPSGYYVKCSFWHTPPLYPPPRQLCLLGIISSRQHAEKYYPITRLVRKYTKITRYWSGQWLFVLASVGTSDRKLVTR